MSASLLITGASFASDPQAQHGEYIARAADCMSCHSRPDGKLFAGGKAIETPFGDIYGPNITPDKQTGIGSWTKDDFSNALRQGIRKDGAPLYPAMPYINYTKMTDDDLNDLWAYMQTIPAVSNRVPDNTFRFPFNIRSGLAAWRALYFKPGRFTPAADKNTNWNRGAYLVEALGHCDACHTPRNIAQATEQQRQLTGAQIQGWYAPDIGNDPFSNLSTWNVDQLAHFLKTGHAPGNANAFGPMREVVHDSLSHLGDADLHAIATYLKAAPSPAEQENTRPVAINSELLAEGKAVYLQHCSSCHQDDGRGSKGAVPALAGNTAVTAREPYNVIMATLQGFNPHGVWGTMPAFSNVLNDQQIAAVADYVRTAWGNGGEPNVNQWVVADWRGMAQEPPNGQRSGVICPSLPEEVIRPALNEGKTALEQASDDPAKLQKLVGEYRAARPKASTAQVIEALSTAYCRAVTADEASPTQAGWKVAEFSQQVTIALTHQGSAAPQTDPKITHPH